MTDLEYYAEALEKISSKLLFLEDNTGVTSASLDGREIDRIVFRGDNRLHIYLKPEGVIIIHNTTKVSVNPFDKANFPPPDNDDVSKY
jgi:hypothetical protein